MLKFSKTILTCLLFQLCFSLPSFAQSLAREIGEEYFESMRKAGATVTIGSKITTANSVEWRDISTLAADGATANMAFMRAEEIGGGRVRMTYPDILRSRRSSGSGDQKFDIVITQKNLSHLVSGEADARHYEFGTEFVSLKVDSIDSDFKFEVLFRDTVSSSVVSGDTLDRISGTASADKVEISYSFFGDDTEATGQLSFASMSFDGFLENPAALYAVDFTREMGDYQLNLVFGAGKHTLKIDQPNFKGTLTSSSENSVFEVSILNGQARLTTSVSKPNLGVQFTELPLPPLQASFDSWLVSYEMPILKSDTPSPMTVKHNFDGLIVSDEVWGLIDPKNILPHGKASLKLDTVLAVRWLVDMFDLGDPDKLDVLGLEDEVPLLFTGFDINDLSLEAAGARLQGDGSFVIAENRTEITGAADFTLKGGLGLLDNLVAMGLIPEEQGKLAKMFSGMFAVPVGDGPDHLTTKIEMKAGGSILVNGNKIK